VARASEGLPLDDKTIPRALLGLAPRVELLAKIRGV
jgi:hypothetical protein